MKGAQARQHWRRMKGERKLSLQGRLTMQMLRVVLLEARSPSKLNERVREGICVGVESRRGVGGIRKRGRKKRENKN